MHHLMLTSSPGETFIRRPCLFLLSWPGSSLQFQLQAATENGNVGTLFWLLQLQKSPIKSRQDLRFLPSSVVLLFNSRSGYIICSITDKRQGRLYRIVCIGVCNCNYMFVVQNETGDGFGALALHVCLYLCMGKQLHHTNGLQLGIQDLNIGIYMYLQCQIARNMKRPTDNIFDSLLLGFSLNSSACQVSLPFLMEGEGEGDRGEGHRVDLKRYSPMMGVPLLQLPPEV